MSGEGVDPQVRRFATEDGKVKASLYSDGINEDSVRLTVWITTGPGEGVKVHELEEEAGQ